MRNNFNYLQSTLILASLASLPLGCGSLKSAAHPPVQPVNPIVTTGMSPQERAQYCFVHADRDTDQTQADFLKELAGTWIYIPHTPASDGLERVEFALDTGRGDAAITKYYQLWKDPEDIQYKKACVSKPLDASRGTYAGYRIVEFMASNNDGGAAMLVKYDDTQGDSSPALYLSNYYYQQNAGDDSLAKVSDVIKSATDITVFRAHR